jgi:DNA-binding MarR family transcriptional regulator
VERTREFSARDLEIIYQETDRLYNTIARGCGVSESAYWILFDILESDGTIAIKALINERLIARQTVSSSLQALERRGLVDLDFLPGSSKNKQAQLTEAGWDFCQKNIKPAVDAEQRAFERMSPEDRREFVRLTTAYATYVRQELEELEATGEEMVHE